MPAQWEYRVHVIEKANSVSAQKLEAELNEYGLAHWELVTAATPVLHQQTHYVLVFQRQLPS